MPDTADAYILRIGRTGRVKRTGEAFTLITPDDHAMVQKIEKVMKQKLPQQTLPDFDYDVPKPDYPQTARNPRPHKKRTSPSRPKLRARHPHQTN
jgi:ATP-dependent RNA helicase RhlE